MSLLGELLFGNFGLMNEVAAQRVSRLSYLAAKIKRQGRSMVQTDGCRVHTQVARAAFRIQMTLMSAGNVSLRVSVRLRQSGWSSRDYVSLPPVTDNQRGKITGFICLFGD